MNRKEKRKLIERGAEISLLVLQLFQKDDPVTVIMGLGMAAAVATQYSQVDDVRGHYDALMKQAFDLVEAKRLRDKQVDEPPTIQ